ncbi:MAG: DUF177 domain-containing protein [Melioribacteraceae bacterium]|nr:DUF177 domain-containing protein [Melioribacteraceae bacterium]
MPIVIKHTNLNEGIHHYQFDESASSLGLEDPFYGDISVECALDKSNHQIVLDVSVISDTEFDCDRCGENFKAEIESEFELIYFFDEESGSNGDDNTFYLPPEQDKIDITESIVENVLISIPMKKLCDDECKGLCVKCGCNLNENTCECNKDNINPAWEKLLKLKDK